MLPSTLLPVVPLLLLAAGGSPALSTSDDRDVAASLALPDVDVSDVSRWTKRIAPTRDELAHEAIPWIADFAEGLREADRQQKPLLFWAMNGHPLGCT